MPGSRSEPAELSEVRRLEPTFAKLAHDRFSSGKKTELGSLAQTSNGVASLAPAGKPFDATTGARQDDRFRSELLGDPGNVHHVIGRSKGIYAAPVIPLLVAVAMAPQNEQLAIHGKASIRSWVDDAEGQGRRLTIGQRQPFELVEGIVGIVLGDELSQCGRWRPAVFQQTRLGRRFEVTEILIAPNDKTMLPLGIQGLHQR